MTWRAELEKIWHTRPLANSCNLTGWMDIKTARQVNKGYYEVTGLMPYRGKRLTLKLASRKAAIFKHQRLG